MQCLGQTAVALMDTPCTNSLGGATAGHKHGGDEGRKLCWKFCHRFLVGTVRPSMLMLSWSAAALATMRPVLLLWSVLKKAARR